MPVLEAVQTFAGIANENEFYSHHYLAEVFKGDIKARNMRNILIAMELDGPLTISDLAAFTRIHRVTVYRLLKILLENGDVVVPDRGVYALSANHTPILSNAEKKVLRRPGKK